VPRPSRIPFHFIRATLAKASAGVPTATHASASRSQRPPRAASRSCAGDGQHHQGIDPKRPLTLHIVKRCAQSVDVIGQHPRAPITQGNGEEIGRPGKACTAIIDQGEPESFMSQKNHRSPYAAQRNTGHPMPRPSRIPFHFIRATLARHRHRSIGRNRPHQVPAKHRPVIVVIVARMQRSGIREIPCHDHPGFHFISSGLHWLTNTRPDPLSSPPHQKDDLGGATGCRPRSSRSRRAVLRWRSRWWSC